MGDPGDEKALATRQTSGISDPSHNYGASISVSYPESAEDSGPYISARLRDQRSPATAKESRVRYF